MVRIVKKTVFGVVTVTGLSYTFLGAVVLLSFFLNLVRTNFLS